VDDELERAIAGHLAAGDLAAAATTALRELGPQIYGYLCALLRDDDIARDVFGQFGEELWKSIGSFRGESAFKTWAYTLTMRAVGRHRRDPYHKRAQPLDDVISGLVDDIRSSTPPYRKSEVKDRFAQLRESLDPADQALLFLRVDQQLPWNDVAAVLAGEGEPVEVSTLRKRFERVKERLRELVAKDGLLDDH
jgi:RNA polymerase sigma-70 factor, ECF subfamily